MAELADIRGALANALSGLPDTQVSAYMLANPTPPAVHVLPGATEYDQAFHRGLDRWVLQIQGFVPLTSDLAAQQRLDRWVAAEGSESIKALIESDKTLGGVAQNCRVMSCSGYQQLILEGRPPLLMSEWNVEVWATSS